MDKFDLEQYILRAWCIKDDISLVAESLEEFSKEELSAKAADALGNRLLALETLLELRFQKLWEEFEKLG